MPDIASVPSVPADLLKDFKAETSGRRPRLPFTFLNTEDKTGRSMSVNGKLAPGEAEQRGGERETVSWRGPLKCRTDSKGKGATPGILGDNLRDTQAS